jgi:FKBP-type peptidyl-prolyl cis-trans isomerase FkpA
MKLIAGVLLMALTVAGCSDDGGSPTSPSANIPYSTTDLRVGTGAEATAGRQVVVNYSGWLYSTTAPDNKGTLFDSGTYPFVAGSNQAIEGFSRAVVGMRVGGLRRVVIPPNLGYGAAGSPPRIPGNATLLFEIELTAVQ